MEKESVEKLLAAISREIKVSGREAVGILVDANDDVAARWQAVKDRLAQANVQLPNNPVPSGAIIEGNPRVGVWLMPDNYAGRANLKTS